MADQIREIIMRISAQNKAKAAMAGFRSDLDRTGATVKRLGRSMMALAGVGGGLYLLQRGIRGVMSTAMEQEKAERELSAALMATGTSSEYVNNSLKRYAASLQRLTIYGDEQIISQMAYAANLGVTTDKLKEATKAAMGLAARYRLDLKTAMMLVGRASQGQTQMLTRYGIVLDENLTVQEKFNALLKIGADNFQLAEAETETAAGAMKQFKIVIGDLAEQLGDTFLPAITRGVVDLKNKIDSLVEATDAYKRITGDINVGRETYQRGIYSFGAMPNPAQAPEYPKLFEHFKRQAAAGEPIGLFPPQEIIDAQVAKYEKAGAKEVKIIEQTTEEAEKAAAKREQIIAKMYSDMGKSASGYYDRQKSLLEQQKIDYGEHVKDKLLLEEWYASELAGIQQEMYESNRNAMDEYYDELMSKVENASVNVARKLKEVANSSERAMSNMYQTMIKDTRDWRSAMEKLFNDVGDAFSKMAGDLLAEYTMAGVLGVGGSALGVFGGLFGLHSGWVPEGVPSFHTGRAPKGVPSFQRGRGLKSNEMVAVFEKDELIAPSKQIVRSTGGNIQGGGQTIYVENYFENTHIDATDAESFQRLLADQQSFLADLHFDSKRHNHPNRRSSG